MSLFLSPSSSLFLTPWKTFQSGMVSKPCRETGLESAPAATSISNSRWILAHFLFIHHSHFLSISLPFSTKCFPVAPPFPALLFHLFLPKHWLLALFWIPLFIYIFLLKIMYQNIKIFTLLFAFSGCFHLQVAIYPNRWFQRLVSIEFSKSHIYSFSRVCQFKLRGSKKPTGSPMSTPIKPLSWKMITQVSPLI